MEFRKMVTITLYMRQQKRYWCIEQSFGLCGRGRGWDDLGEWHWNMYNIIYEMSRQSRFNAWYWMLGVGALGRPRGMVRGGRREEDSERGTRVYLWRIHVDIWQNQYNIVKLKKKKNTYLSRFIWNHTPSLWMLHGHDKFPCSILVLNFCCILRNIWETIKILDAQVHPYPLNQKIQRCAQAWSNLKFSRWFQWTIRFKY